MGTCIIVVEELEAIRGAEDFARAIRYEQSPIKEKRI